MKLQALLDRLATTVKGYIDRRLGEVDTQLKAISDEVPRRIDEAIRGCDEQFRKMVEAAIPAPLKGEPGDKPTVEELKALIAPMIPPPIHGRTPTADEIKALIPEPVPGRDALDIAPLPLIDEAKSYPRGTYATHKGGLWRSFEQTKGLKGWECLVNGFNGYEEEQIDERTFIARTFTSTGVFEVTRKVQSLVYRQLWVATKDYEQGDCVTWGGSMWVAIKHEGQYKQPGTEGSGWRLAVRAGRDGDRS